MSTRSDLDDLRQRVAQRESLPAASKETTRITILFAALVVVLSAGLLTGSSWVDMTIASFALAMMWLALVLV